MKTLNKIFILTLTVALLVTLVSVPAFAAESTEISQESSESTVSLEDVKFVFKYTSDSAVTTGLTTRVYSDPISNIYGIELIPDFGVGYAIYDNPDTEIIDGIRINGMEVTSLIIPMSEDSPAQYEVSVRTVYKEDASGSLAQLLDGTYDYSKLLTNPVIIFQLVYWVFMAIAAIAGCIITITNKNKKVQTSDEIASKVTASSEAMKEDIINVVTNVVKAEILPLAQASVNSGKEAVKAIILSTSKSKDAPSALLDVFKESLDIDIKNILDEVKEELLQYKNKKEVEHIANATALHEIATNVIQEDVSHATETTETSKTQKSVF